MAPLQNTRMSESHDGMALPQACIVTSAPDPSRPMMTARVSTGEPSFSSHAATSLKPSPARSATVLSMCAPVSNRKPPPDCLTSWRHVPAVPCAQSCQTTASMPRMVPSSPDRSMRDAVRTCGDRLPWNETTSSRPVRSRVEMSAVASSAFMTIGFSSRTSRPASRQAEACSKWRACGVTMKTASRRSA